MSTRATINIETSSEGSVSIYKHHDGYVKGGLGQALMEFVLYARGFNNSKGFLKDFVTFTNADEKVFGFELNAFGKIHSDFWAKGEEFKSHSDTEYHYTLSLRHNNGYALFVQKRDYENGSQNGADKTETGHWTDFAEKELIGLSGLFFDHKIA